MLLGPGGRSFRTSLGQIGIISGSLENQMETEMENGMIQGFCRDEGGLSFISQKKSVNACITEATAGWQLACEGFPDTKGS